MRLILCVLVTIHLFNQIAAAGTDHINIRDCADVRGLAREQAAERHRVKIRGVVTYVEGDNALVIQDGADGVYIEGKKNLFQTGVDSEPRIGTLLEVTGETAPGVVAPMVRAEEIRFLGQETLPPSIKVRVADLQTGVFDCRRITIHGVAQRAFRDESGNSQERHRNFSTGLRMEIATPDGSFSAFIKDPINLKVNDLVDAELTLTGVCYTLSNPRGEFIGAVLYIQDSSGVEIVKPAPADPYSVSIVSSFSLRPYSKQGPNFHRQLLEGIVTLSKPGEFFFLQMKERAVKINTRSPMPVFPGDRIVATGFVDQSRGFAQIKEALFRTTGRSQILEPKIVTVSKILNWEHFPNNDLLRREDYDGVLIRLKGRLINVETFRDSPPRLFLDADGTVVTASFVSNTASTDIMRLPLGSEVEVTGVCTLTLTDNWPSTLLPVPEGFSVLLQSPDSVRILRQPPWWTATRLKNALLAMSVFLAVALASIVFLRRTVARRTSQLVTEMQSRQDKEMALRDAKLEFKATLAERERVAADLHDNLEQALTGVAMQIEATRTAPTSEIAVRNLRLAGQMLALSREDVRRSVWNLRAQALDGQSFVEAIGQVAGTILDQAGIQFSLESIGEERPLSDFVASNILILTKEALTNSVKHSRATCVVVSANFSREALTLTICDNGCGFTKDSAPGPHEGHFGLTGMRERVARLSGRFSIESRPGAGTTITVFVPAGKDEDPVAANGPELLAKAAENDA